MKASFDKIDNVIEFTGSWGIASKCGLKRSSYNGKDVILVTELYKDNPGTPITQVTASLAMQVCEKLNIDPKNLIYIEHSPDMNSKLSFYDEVFYNVSFEIVDGKFINPSWKILAADEIEMYLK
ncbi:MAG: hypothetical protein LLG13_01450 [Bacteroidales bacterium]|nr:hypothetical protein [Bacteroidales bacterium]